MTNRLELNWKLDGFVDEQRYYCSETPIDIENLPEPKAVLAGDVRTYIDTDITVSKTYYVAVGSVKNLVEKLSDIKVLAPRIYHVWLEFNAAGIVKKGTSLVDFTNSGGVITQMPDGSYAIRLSSANTYLYSSAGSPVSGDVEIEMVFTPLAWPASFGAWYDSRLSAGSATNGQILGFNNGNAYVEFRNGSATWAGGYLSTSLHVLNKKTKATFIRIGNVWKYYIDDIFVSNLSIADPFLSNIMQNQTFIGRVKDGNSGYHLNGYLHRWSIRKL